MIEDEKTPPVRKLIITGIPMFLIAVTISMLTHQIAHRIVEHAVCGEHRGNAPSIVAVIDMHRDDSTCAAGSMAGMCWTLFLAIASFALFVRKPANLFLASMAFVNASARLPETLTVFLQLLFNGKTKLVVDESVALTLLHFQDPSISILLLFFLTLVTLSLTVTIVYDTRVIPWKWPVALILFLLIVPVENLAWGIFSPILR